jgi:hypothetical protein
MKYTKAQMNRMKEANKARQAAQPLKLIKLVKELQQESGRVAEDSRTLNAAHQNAAAAELASRLKAKLYNPNNQQGLRHKSRHPKTLPFQVRKLHINWVDLQ